MSVSRLRIKLRGETLELLPEKAIYWESQRSLLISDLHLGKAGHFRKNGIPIPNTIHSNDLDRITILLREYSISKLICLGDLFHSDFNREWNDFSQWLDLHEDVEFILVRGNHDILPMNKYLESKMTVFESLEKGPFTFSHKEQLRSSLFNISGHVHPCVRLRGPGKQGLRLPCFYFNEKSGLLPAFGNFTGSYPIRPKKNDQVFGILDNTVVNLMG